MDSTPPVIFKRTKAKSAQRTRQGSPEDGAEGTADATLADSPSTLATKLKNKVKRAKPKSRLSFGGNDDEEGGGEVFQVKKSNLSRKLALGTHPASVPLNLEQATISPNRGPTYDQAYLKELKASTPSSRPPPVSDVYDADMSMDVEEVSTMAMSTTDSFSEAIIPTESSIKVAKERRERLRKTGVSGEEEFISLSVVRKSDEYQGPHPESRLMREEDELGEGDDEFSEYTSAQDRIALGKKSRKVEANKRRDAMKEMIEDVEEDDEESAEWMEEQLRRGGHLGVSSRPSTPPVKQTYKPAPIPAATSIPTLGPSMARLTEQLTLLTTSHAKNTAAMNNLAKERAEVADREAEMRAMVGRAEDKRAWFESFKDWLEGVAGFLDEKYPLLETLEEEHISLLQERSRLISNRRRLEDEDDLSVIFGVLHITPPTEPDVEETDELGRTVPKPSPAVMKRERREARLRRRQLRLQQKPKTEEEEGYSTDSSLPQHDQSDYISALKSLATRTKDVLADVRAAEFIDPGKGRWSVWREKYAESYVGAWGGLGVVSVWEFWVRLETVGWDCIEDPRSLDSFKWYNGLYAYSRPGDGELGENELGPDGDLVASMISTAVIPRLSAIIAGGAFDPYSEVHTRRAIDLAEEVEASVEEGNIKLQTLLKSIVTTYQTTITDTEALLAQFKAARRGAPGFDPEAIPARRRFLARRVKLLRNLLRWRKHTGERYGAGALAKRLAESCLLDVAASGWEVGGEDIARTTATMLPDDLIPYELKRRLGIR
ncbi:nineteen complex-related protein 2-domain-containing protein [Lyophyllum atratum]|nr:nineteen complex-related protein 2-domain-containing protein [Lyophyllum atratum]